MILYMIYANIDQYKGYVTQEHLMSFCFLGIGQYYGSMNDIS